jgi:uncharacterized protein YdhG (YjbR/CyaY superfamily)
MEQDQLSAQATPTSPENTENAGIQARINELTAARRQAEEQVKLQQQQLIEQSAKMAEMALQQRTAQAPAPQPQVDPLAQFKDQLDPVAMQAIQAAVAETQRRLEAQYAPMFAQQASQIAGFAVQQEAAAIPNLPKEVGQRAAQLAAQWRQAGLSFPPGDALNFALGEYQRGQLLKAAPVAGYNPAAQTIPAVVPGYALPPQAPRTALPSNFDALPRQQQNDILEKSGLLDAPL